MSTTLHTTLTSTLAPQSSTMLVSQRSLWQSPVTYLFGGLAAMLGLIAFALLLLACSYWRLSREQQQSEQDLEKGDGISKIKGPLVYEEKIVVIMAGNDIPTFLANPTPKQVVLVVDPSSNKLEVCDQQDDDECLATTTSSDDSKAKDDENDQHHN